MAWSWGLSSEIILMCYLHEEPGHWLPLDHVLFKKYQLLKMSQAFNDRDSVQTEVKFSFICKLLLVDIW